MALFRGLWIVGFWILGTAHLGCQHLEFNESRLRDDRSSINQGQKLCASNDSRAVAYVCLRQGRNSKKPADPKLVLRDLLTKNLVECSTASKQEQAELIVSETTITLKRDNNEVVETAREAELEETLTKNKVLPVGSCEHAFIDEMLVRQKKPLTQRFFQHDDGFVPEVLYRGTALADAEVARLLGPDPQHVVTSWAYFKAQQALDPKRQDSTLAALGLREKIFASLMNEWKAASKVRPEQAENAELIPMLNLHLEAMSKTLVGVDRSQITARGFSSSATFYDSYSYAKMNVSPQKIGLVLSYRNKLGRSLYVTSSEWVTFSHVPKSDQIEAYLVVPRSDAVVSAEENSTVFYVYRDGYEVYRVKGFSPKGLSGLRLARCTLSENWYLERQNSGERPSCPSDVSAAEIKDPSLPERLKDLLAQVPR